MGSTWSDFYPDVPQGQVGWNVLKTEKMGETPRLINTNVYREEEHIIKTDGYSF